MAFFLIEYNSIRSISLFWRQLIYRKFNPCFTSFGSALFLKLILSQVSSIYTNIIIADGLIEMKIKFKIVFI